MRQQLDTSRTYDISQGDRLFSAHVMTFMSNDLGFSIRIDCKAVRNIRYIDPDSNFADWDDPFVDEFGDIGEKDEMNDFEIEEKERKDLYS